MSCRCLLKGPGTRGRGARNSPLPRLPAGREAPEWGFLRHYAIHEDEDDEALWRDGTLQQ